MTKHHIPIFLDCEASSLSSDSYPVEIAWSNELGNIESHLINPEGYLEAYDDWSQSAQKIHGLSRKYLIENGELPELVALRLNQTLENKTVYTDAPDFDGFWCQRLFDSVDVKRNFKFASINDLLTKFLPHEYWHTQAVSRQMNMDALYKRARNECGVEAHRAENDVAYLLKLYQICRQKGGYYS